MKQLLFSIALLLFFDFTIRAQANTALSNLVPATAINMHLKPKTTGTLDLGKPDSAWRNLYLNGAIFVIGKRFVDNRTVGDNNFIGSFSGTNNTTGTRNNSLGNGALAFNTKGSDNTAIGYASMFYSTEGSSNTTLGAYASHTNTTGYSNVAIGKAALFSNTEGHNLVAIGDSALYNQARTNGGEFPYFTYRNTAIGSKALYKNITGYGNTATGFNSLFSNTYGTDNTATGGESLFYNTTGSGNTATGQGSLFSNTTGASNSALGAGALRSNTTASYGTAVGGGALFSNTSGIANTAVGNTALYNNRTGIYNTAVGYGALGAISTLSKNTAVGFMAGNTYETSASTYLGHGATSIKAGIDNSTALGFETRVTASNQVRIGNTAVTSIGGQVGWSTLSDGRFKKNVKEDVPGLVFITQLRPVTYTLDVEKIETALKGNISPADASKPEGTNAAKSEKAKIIHTGFIAQEVEAMAKKLNYDFSGVDKPMNGSDFYGLRYAEFVVPLIKAVQELNTENQELKEELSELRKLVMEIKNGTVNSKNNLSSAYLEQNAPNPFNANTVIRYHVSGGSANSQLIITDIKGAVVKTLPLVKGSSYVSIDSHSLAAGTYTYSLWMDGKQVDVKKMVVSR